MTDLAETPDAEAGRAAKPRAWKGLIFFLFVMVLGAGLAAFVLTQRSDSGPKVVTDAPLPIPVEVARVSLQDSFEIDERYTGLVTPARTSGLGFTTGGRIDAIYVDVGDRVQQGQTLAKLDTRGLEAQLAAAKATVTEARATHALALSTADRQATLAGKGFASQQGVDEAVAQADTAMARIEAAKANADALRVQISLARIIAPYNGIVTERLSDEGAIAAPSQTIFELVERDRLEARIGLTQKLSETLIAGETYQLQGQDGEVAARLRSVTGVIDARLRTVSAVFDILDPERVTPGAVIRLGMQQSIDERGFWVPITALAESERGLWSVYVVRDRNGQDVAVPDNVEVIHTDGEMVYVRGGVRDGDSVITDGLHRLAPGQPVTPTASTVTASAGQEG